MQYWTAEPVAAQGPRKGEPSSASMRYGFRTQPARLVRGSSRRIMTMRFRPANIRVINRRVCCWAVIGPAVQTGPENHLGRVKPNRTEGQGERNLRFLSPLESPFFPQRRQRPNGPPDITGRSSELTSRTVFPPSRPSKVRSMPERCSPFRPDRDRDGRLRRNTRRPAPKTRAGFPPLVGKPAQFQNAVKPDGA